MNSKIILLVIAIIVSSSVMFAGCSDVDNGSSRRSGGGYNVPQKTDPIQTTQVPPKSSYLSVESDPPGATVEVGIKPKFPT